MTQIYKNYMNKEKSYCQTGFFYVPFPIKSSEELALPSYIDNILCLKFFKIRK